MLVEKFMDKPPIDWKTVRNKGMYKKYKYLKEYIHDMKTLKNIGENYEGMYRIFTESAANILEEWFESDILKGAFTNDCVFGALHSPYSKGSAYLLLHLMAGGINGVNGH